MFTTLPFQGLIRLFMYKITEDYVTLQFLALEYNQVLAYGTQIKFIKSLLDKSVHIKICLNN